MTEAGGGFSELYFVLTPAENNGGGGKLTHYLVAEESAREIAVLYVDYKNILLNCKISEARCIAVKMNKAVLTEAVLVLLIKVLKVFKINFILTDICALCKTERNCRFLKLCCYGKPAV